MMKKYFILILVIALTLAMPLTTYANEITTNNEGTNNVDITANINLTYTITIPDSITFDTNATTTTANVSVSNVYLEGTTLYISLISQNDWYLVNGSTNIAYDAQIENMSIKDQIIPIQSGESTSADIVFSILDEVKHSGYYEDMLTFNVDVH